jgi:hypothetical protein
MPRDLLISKGASITGQWVKVYPPGHKTWPFRVITVNGSTAFAGENVYIEELTGGLPSGPGPIQDNPGLLTAGSQTGVVGTLLTIAPAGTANGYAGDNLIEAPVEYIRARTGAFSAGTVSVRLIEAE